MDYRPGLRRFAAFGRKLKLDVGRPLALEKFQREIASYYFGGAVETVVVLPKKNYKTTTLAALALDHIDQVEDAECVVAAASRDQATILFNQAAGLVRRSELEHFDVKSGYREIRHRKLRGRIRILAADAATADGVIPTLALVDELHRHPSGELYGVFRDGLGPRNGRMMTISTAGWDMTSPLGVLREKAHALATFTREDAHNIAVSPDGSFVWLEWCLENTDDLGNMRLVKRANPARVHTIASLRRRYESPTTTPGQWARFACGVWTAGEESWVQPQEWDALAVDIGGVIDGEEVFVAVSHGTAGGIGIAAQREDGVACLGIDLGDISLAEMERKVAALTERFTITQVAYDRVEFARSAEILAERGMPTTEVPHSPERLSIASATMHRLIQSQQLRHDGDRALRAQVLGSATRETERGWRLVKTPRNRALIAVAIAVHQASKHSPMPMVRFA